jgi:hypothetical protein
MADLLKRLQTSEQQYGVGMEDNPFHNASPDECMHTCFGGSGGGSPPPPPPSTVTQQTSNIPEYFQPYLERLFERAEAVTTEPFQRYEGQRLATTTPQQQAAYQGVEEMVGGYKPYIATADILTQQAAQQSTDPAAIASRMSPYQQSVIDIQKREALRDANKLQQQIGASAVGAGAFGGSRQALQESELGRQTGQRLADIQAVGSQQAYQQAMNQLAADRAASLAAGQQFAGLGAQQQQLGLAGLGALETVGGTQQAQQQRALDIGYEDFARETTRPSQQVQEMSSVLRGFNLPVSTYTTSQAQQAPPTFGQQAAGLGLGALGIYGAGKGVGLFAEGGEVPDNPGIKKLAAKAPQVVEKMGFDPQEVMNAYVGGKMTFQKGGGSDLAEAAKQSQPIVGKSLFEDIYTGVSRPFESLKSNPLLKYFGRPLSTVAGTVYDTSSKATEYLTGMDLPNYKEAFPKASEFGPSVGEYVTNKDLKLIGSDDKEKDKDEIDAKIEPPKKDVDEKDEVVIPVEKEETTLDILKRMAQPKEEEGIDIMQAKTGLLDLIAAEDIRTGRAGAEEAAKRITERGLAQQKFEADEINKDFARMVAINELDLKERSLAADNTKAIYKYMMDTLKLRGDQATKVFESLSKNSPMLLSEDMETAIPKLIEQTNSIVGKLGMAPSTTLPSTEDTKIKSPSGITSFIKKLTGTE